MKSIRSLQAFWEGIVIRGAGQDNVGAAAQEQYNVMVSNGPRRS